MSESNRPYNRLGVVTPGSRPTAKPPGLLRVIQKNSVSHYEQFLAHLFSSSDDLFYDLSKRASSNKEQNLYFEAMREIRIKRERIANQFLRALVAAFSRFIEPKSKADSSDESYEDDDSPLSVVKGDDLEIELAISNMVSRTRDTYRTELHELAARLDHLLLHVDLSEKNNPLDPLLIAESFVDACQEGLDTDIKAKLILFKLFEKHVLKQLGHIYADANKVLLEAGILPKVPSSLRRRRDDPRGDASKGASENLGQIPAGASPPFGAIGNPPVADFSMQQSALSVLLDAAKNYSNVLSHSGGATGAGQLSGGFQTPRYYIGMATRSDTKQSLNCYIYSGNPGPVMSQPELTKKLTQSQLDLDKRFTGSEQPQNVVPLVVQQLLKQSDPKSPQALDQSDENVINLVSMFFDEILADDSLHPVVQALICRLQIPILKVALRDAAFFSESMHPARKLINTITSLGIGFDESKPIEKDPVFKKISEIVKTLNSNYGVDDGIFERLQDDLDVFVAKESTRAQTVEQRTTETEEGKTKIKYARAIAQDLIYQKLRELELPDAVKHFLITHWIQVMVLNYLKHGAESKQWAANEQTITDLIWVSADHQDARSIQRRERMLPELLDRLERALESVIANPSVRKDSIDALEGVLTSEDNGAERAKVSSLSENERDALGKGQSAPKPWAEMTAVEKQKARYEELEAKYFQMAKDISIGSWLQYTDGESGKTVRCKLASKMDADTYLFTNRMGFKVLEKTRKQLAYDMQFKKVKILDARPMFDRIMSSIVDSMSSSDS